MLEHTYNKDRYAVVIGRHCFFYERPAKTKRNEAYREPKPAGRKRYQNKAEASAAAQAWERA